VSLKFRTFVVLDAAGAWILSTRPNSLNSNPSRCRPLEAKRREKELALDVKRRQKNGLMLDHENARHEEQTHFFHRMRELQIGLTHYFRAQSN
jgi:hypothetical protein